MYIISVVRSNLDLVLPKKFFKLVFTVFLLVIEHERDCAENKPQVRLLCPWKKQLIDFTVFTWRADDGASNLLVVVFQTD